MNKLELNIIDLLEYLQDMLDSSAKMPITGKVMVDKKEFNEVIDQIINYLPDQLKKAEWIMGEKDRILSEAQKEFEIARKETAQMMKQSVENHDIVKEAKMRELERYAQELTQDISEMIEDASPEEKQLLYKKMSTLAEKLNNV